MTVGLPLTLLIGLGFLSIREARADTISYDTSGDFTVPGGVESITVQAWGAGGGGGGSGTGSFGGGGGGAYASQTLAVSPGQVYTITVGTGGSGGDEASAVPSAGTDSSISLQGSGTALVKAAGGSAGSGSNGGIGGTTANSVGTTKYAGGNGANSSGNSGGGGGGSATTTSAGGNATGSTGGTGTGSGGAGGAAAAGTAGSTPGGGGGGKGNGSSTSGAGAAGRVTITYTVPQPASFNGIPASQNYTERTSGKLLIAPAADLSDADSTDFDGGYLRVAFTANGEPAEDRLFLREINNITLVSNLSITNGTFSGSIEVRHSGTLIGTIAAANRGADGTALQIDLNANATVARTQDLLRSVYYENLDKENAVASTRTLRITLNDGDGGTATADSDLVVIAEAFSITSPSTGWTRLLNSTAFDPSEDQQAMSGPDLVGTLGTPLLYAKYDDKGTSSTADDTVTFRLRVDDSTNNAGFYNGYIFLGYDFELDGDIDAFISMEGTTKGTKTYVYPASGANISPSTTGLGTRQLIPNYNTSTMSNYSTVQAIEANSQAEANTYSGSDADFDYFQTFQMNYADLASVLNGISLNNHINAGNGYTTIGDLLVAGDFRTGFTEKTPFRFIIATSTQPNAINSDFGGVPRIDRTSASLSWEALGAFSPQVTFGNLSPTFTSGDGATASYTVAEGTTAVTTVSASDPNDDTITFGIRTGVGYGVDGTQFQIDPHTGALRFVSAPDYEVPSDDGLDNSYEVTVEISDGKGGTTLQLVIVYVTDLNEGVNSRPVITSNGAGADASISISENTTSVTTVTSSDDGDFSGTVIPATATYSISGGADAAKFVIEPATGLLSFVSAPDYENALDADQGNTYVVVVRVTDDGSPVYSDDQTITVTILDVPEPLAPVLTPWAPTLPALTEDETGNAGQTVAQILGASATDTTGTIIGMAISGISATNGLWEYSLDGGANWIPVGSTVDYQLVEDDSGNLTTTAVFTTAGSLSDANALLLRAEDYVRFKPNAENAGGGTFTYRAWDESSGFAGDYADATSNGGTTAFSSSSDTATITTTDVNDAPTVAGGPVTLTSIRDYQTSATTTVASVVGAITYGDVDTGHGVGIGVVGSSGSGTWQYSDDGVTWTSMGSVSDSSALLLPSTYRIRYVPAYAGPDGGETATLTVRGWDQTSPAPESAGTKVAASTNGGTSSFSSSTFSVEITVDEDDRPVSVTGGTVNEGSTWAVFSITGAAGQLVSLSLVEGSGAGYADLDETQILEWWNPSANAGAGGWVAYSSYATVPTGGTILVRVNITQEQDSDVEGAETFQLSAANLSGASSSATMTISDDGTGLIYPDAPPASASTPATSSSGLDDDRAMSLTNLTVNEASPWAVFTLTGIEGQTAILSILNNGDGSDLVTIEHFDGVEWQPYSSSVVLPLNGPANGESATMLLRVALAPEQEAAIDGPETFTLVAATTSNKPSTGGVGTITDDGSGSIFLDSNDTANPDDPSAPGYSGPSLDDDRPSGTSPEINLRGGQISIRSGKTTLDSYDATDFGIAKAGAGGTSVVLTFTIENVGTGDLTLGGTPVVSVSGTNASDFSVSQPSSANLAAGGSRTFTITFTPSSTGLRSATVSILNNDSDESPYTFAIGGEGRSNLAPIDLTFTGGRLEDGLDATDDSPAYSGYFTASPDLGVDTDAAAYNTFTLVPGVGGSDNAKFQIYDGNKLRLRLGEPSADGLTDYQTRNSRRSSYNLRVEVSDHEGNTYQKAFVVYVMMILSGEGDFIISDRGPYVSTGSVLLVSKEGFIQRIFSTTIADPYEITVDGNGDMIISNHEHDLSNVTALDDSGIYKIDRLSGVQTKIVGGATNGSVMPFVTPLGVKVETAGTYIVGDPDAYNFTGAIFRVDPAASPVTITELTRGGNLDYLQGVALAPNGDIYVSNVKRPVGSPSEVLKVDPATGAQTVFASAGDLIYPTGLAVEEDGSAVVVVDALAKKLISIAIPGGTQTVISSDAQFIQPTHIAIEHTGDYLVTDGKSSSFDRRLFRVDKGTGIATELSLNGSFEQPRGVTFAD